MKIKSTSDVITNSSTEVFTLRTNKSLEEVEEILGSLTTGWKKPEVLVRDQGLLKILRENWYYLYDPNSEEDLDRWTFNCFAHGYVPVRATKDQKKSWYDYVSKNLDYLNKYFLEECESWAAKNWKKNRPGENYFPTPDF